MPFDRSRLHRSELAVPASNARMLEKAPAQGADVVMLDLDDAGRIIAAMEEAARKGRGVVSLDGRLMDAASIRMAETLLRKPEQIEARAPAAVAA